MVGGGVMLTREQVVQAKAVFNLVDAERRGAVAQREAQHAARLLGVSLPARCFENRTGVTAAEFVDAVSFALGAGGGGAEEGDEIGAECARLVAAAAPGGGGGQGGPPRVSARRLHEFLRDAEEDTLPRHVADALVEQADCSLDAADVSAEELAALCRKALDRQRLRESREDDA